MEGGKGGREGGADTEPKNKNPTRQCGEKLNTSLLQLPLLYLSLYFAGLPLDLPLLLSSNQKTNL